MTDKVKILCEQIRSVIFLFIIIPGFQNASSQVYGDQEIRWLCVGSLRSWFSNAGSEVEFGRRGRAMALSTDQTDGLRWPAQYRYQDHETAKSIWIGTTDFFDPDTGIQYAHKVVACGPRAAYLESELMPYEFKMTGRFGHPQVIVDGLDAKDNISDDLVDEIDISLKPDRLIINKLHTSIGISICRKIMAFSNQYHDNYFIYDYVFTNTGIIDLDGTTLTPARTLTDVIFHFQYRYAFAYQAFREGWCGVGTSWGTNTLNDVIGENNLADGAPFRALVSWYGPHSDYGTAATDVGHPDQENGTIMAGTQYAGVVTLHASLDAAHFNTDDPYQPFTTQYLGSDHEAQSSIATQYDTERMTQRYNLFMSSGHPPQSHAEQVGLVLPTFGKMKSEVMPRGRDLVLIPCRRMTVYILSWRKGSAASAAKKTWK